MTATELPPPTIPPTITTAAPDPEDNSATQYVLVLRPLHDADGVPAIVRLRKLLKVALRGYRLRCVSARETAGARNLDQPDEHLSEPAASH
jgi:hypothetical protein